MGRCCICGKDTDGNAGGLLIDGRTVPICDDCGKILDSVETMEQSDPKRKELHTHLQEKLKNNGAADAVIEAVNDIFLEETADNVNEFIESEKIEYEREQQEEKAIAEASSGNAIESLCGILSVFAWVFLICGIILSFVIGIPLTNDYYARSTGWSVIFGGIIGTCLSFAMIMLALSVASAIGKINDKMDEANEKIENTNKQLSKIASMLSSSENRKQKK